MKRRDVLKGLVAAPVILQVPKGRADIINFATKKEIITNVVDSDIARIGPENVLDWTSNIDHNVRLSPIVGKPFERDVQIGRRYIEGSVSVYLTSQSLALINQSIDGGNPLRMKLPTNMNGIESTEFLVRISEMGLSAAADTDMVATIYFVIVGPPPQFYEVS